MFILIPMIRKMLFRFVAMLSGLMDDQARQVVEYLKEENRILREQLKDRYGCNASSGSTAGVYA
jgi:ribosomal protein L11 methylase PrmA